MKATFWLWITFLLQQEKQRQCNAQKSVQFS
jgi:hypothetical protein